MDFCEHGHEILVFVTADFFDQLAYYQFLNTNIPIYVKRHNETGRTKPSTARSPKFIKTSPT